VINENRISFFLFFIYALPFRHRVIFDSKEVNKVKIPFLINNLVFIPINVNGVEFLLDSGVKETILFSLEEMKLALKILKNHFRG
jgi:hypothetical protein